MGVEWQVLPRVCACLCLCYKRVIVQCLVKQHSIYEPLKDKAQTALFKDPVRIKQ
jgi:hypothetical protein